jgi:hypothetical protein
MTEHRRWIRHRTTEYRRWIRHRTMEHYRWNPHPAVSVVVPGIDRTAISYRLSAISYWLLAIDSDSLTTHDSCRLRLIADS